MQPHFFICYTIFSENRCRSMKIITDRCVLYMIHVMRATSKTHATSIRGSVKAVQFAAFNQFVRRSCGRRAITPR